MDAIAGEAHRRALVSHRRITDPDGAAGLAGGYWECSGVRCPGVVSRLIERYFQRAPSDLRCAIGLQGLAIGILTTLLFTLPPLIRCPPAVIFRREMVEARDIAAAVGAGARIAGHER
jgi:hypothetical protein